MNLTPAADDGATLSRPLASFGLSGDPAPLRGGTRPTFRVGDTVLKHIHDTSLENQTTARYTQVSREWLKGTLGMSVASSTSGW